MYQISDCQENLSIININISKTHNHKGIFSETDITNFVQKKGMNRNHSFLVCTANRIIKVEDKANNKQIIQEISKQQSLDTGYIKFNNCEIQSLTMILDQIKNTQYCQKINNMKFYHCNFLEFSQSKEKKQQIIDNHKSQSLQCLDRFSLLNLQQINLSDNNLIEFPKPLFYLASTINGCLKMINLNNNLLATVPVQCAKILSQSEVKMFNNPIQKIHGAILSHKSRFIHLKFEMDWLLPIMHQLYIKDINSSEQKAIKQALQQYFCLKQDSLNIFKIKCLADQQSLNSRKEYLVSTLHQKIKQLININDRFYIRNLLSLICQHQDKIEELLLYVFEKKKFQWLSILLNCITQPYNSPNAFQSLPHNFNSSLKIKYTSSPLQNNLKNKQARHLLYRFLSLDENCLPNLSKQIQSNQTISLKIFQQFFNILELNHQAKQQDLKADMDEENNYQSIQRFQKFVQSYKFQKFINLYISSQDSLEYLLATVSNRTAVRIILQSQLLADSHNSIKAIIQNYEFEKQWVLSYFLALDSWAILKKIIQKTSGRFQRYICNQSFWRRVVKPNNKTYKLLKKLEKNYQLKQLKNSDIFIFPEYKVPGQFILRNDVHDYLILQQYEQFQASFINKDLKLTVKYRNKENRFSIAKKISEEIVTNEISRSKCKKGLSLINCSKMKTNNSVPNILINLSENFHRKSVHSINY